MQIKFNNVVVAGSWTEETTDLGRDISNAIQTAENWQASQPIWYDRDLYRASLSWTCQRRFESIVEAELFFLEHLDNEGSTDLTALTGIVQFIMDDGSKTAERFARGKLTARISAPIGVHINTSYTLEYGRLFKTNPDEIT